MPSKHLEVGVENQRLIVPTQPLVLGGNLSRAFLGLVPAGITSQHNRVILVLVLIGRIDIEFGPFLFNQNQVAFLTVVCVDTNK